MATNCHKTTLPVSERPRSSASKFVGHVDPNEDLWALLVVRSRSNTKPSLQSEDLQSAPQKGKRFLSSAEYVNRFGAEQSDIETILSFADDHVLKVLDSHAGRRTVTILGTAQQMNEVFTIRLGRYESPLPGPCTKAATNAREQKSETQIHRGFDGSVQLPGELQDLVVTVVGLDNRTVATPAGASGDPVGATSLSVPTIAGHYNFPTSGASNQIIAVFAPQSANTSGVIQGASYSLNDFNNLYFPSLPAGFQTAPTAINDIQLTVGTTTFQNNPTSVSQLTVANLNTFPSNAILELTSDISISTTIAQGASVNVYFTENSEAGWLVFLNRIIVPGSEAQPWVVTAS